MIHTLSRRPAAGLLSLLFAIGATLQTAADVIVEYDFAGGSVAASTFSPSVTPADYIANVGSVSSSTGTHFVNGGDAVGTTADAITNNWSGEFGLTVDSGMLDLTSLDFTARSDNNEVDDSFTWDVRSSLDGYAASLFTLTHDNGFLDDTAVSVDLTAPEFQGLTGSIDFRIYLSTTHGETLTTSERIRIAQPVTLNGVISGGLAELQLTVDRDTGEITMSNPGGSGLTFIGYEISSGFGSLDASNWASISDSYDVDGTVGPAISSDNWTELTGSNPEAPKNGDLAEIDFESAAGATLGAGASISLGVAAWIPTDVENLSFTYALPDGTEVTGPITFVGNGDVPFAEGDLDTDGDIDADDWNVFRTNLGGRYLDDSQAEAYRRGDLNGDLDVDPFDFVNFQSLFDNANGAGAFAAMLAAVPEPSGLAILAGVIGGLSVCRRRVAVLLAVGVCGVGIGGTAQAQFSEDFESLTLGAAPAQLPDWTFIDLGAVTDDADWQITDDATSGSTFGSLHLSQASTSIDFLETNQPIAGALAIANNSDVDAIDVIDFDFALGGFGDGSGQFLDIKLVFGYRDVDNWHAMQIVAGQSDGANTELDISRVAVVDGVTNRSNVFDTFSTADFSAGFSTSPAVLHGQVIHDSLSGSVSVTISEGGATVYTAAVTNEAFLEDGDVGFGVNNDAVSFDNLVVEALPRLTLQIDPVDGDARLVNATGAPIDLDLYEISSFDAEGEGLGLLDPAGWTSLEDQDLSGFAAGDGTGNGWEAGDGSSADTLIEAVLTGGGSTVAPGQSLFLGELAVDGATDGVAFRYHTPGSGATFVPGIVEYMDVVAPAGLAGDFNGDGVVDAADFTVWRDNVGTAAALSGNGEENGASAGVVDAADYELWRTYFGAASAAPVVTTPEPQSMIIVLGGLLMSLRCRVRRRGVAIAAMAILVTGANDASAIEFDRVYQFGEGEGSTSGSVSVTWDDSSPFVDLSGVNSPTYVSAADRPGAAAEGSTTGISFDGIDDYLQGFRLGNPETSRGAVGWDEVTNGLADVTGAKNYTGLRNRGMQVWAKPNSAGSGNLQSVMADTGQFGILISDDSAGAPTWLLRSGAGVFDSGVEVDFDAWTHVSVVRQFGVGTTLFVDGVAVTRTTSTYDESDTARLIVGANTGGDEITFEGGDDEFFQGTLDQAELFTWGESDEGPDAEPAEDFGDFNFGRDNGFARLPFADGGLSGVAGDVNNDNALDQLDVTAFLAGWQNSNFVDFADDTASDAPVADLNSFAKGDLNFDGVTDFSDAIQLHLALVGAGAGGLDFSLLSVPEPGGVTLLFVGAGAALAGRRRG